MATGTAAALAGPASASGGIPDWPERATGAHRHAGAGGRARRDDRRGTAARRRLAGHRDAAAGARRGTAGAASAGAGAEPLRTPSRGGVTGTAPAPIRVALVDDQELVRAGFRMMLDAQPDMCVTGEAADGLDAVALAARGAADVDGDGRADAPAGRGGGGPADLRGRRRRAGRGCSC